MKARKFLLIGLVGLLTSAWALPALAQEDAPARRGPRQRGMMRQRMTRPGQGRRELTDEQRQAIQARIAQRREKCVATMIEKFDKDGDGKLSAEELTAALAARREMMQQRRQKMRQHRAELLKQSDKDGDGKLSPEERQAARETMRTRMAERRAELLKQFDKDGDGKLSPEEREAARDTFRQRVRERRQTPQPAPAE